MKRFDRFTARAQEAGARSYEVVQRYGHTQVDSEHLLLALMEQPEGAVPQILERMGLELDAIRERLHEGLQHTVPSQIYGGGVHHVYITPKLKRVLDLSAKEATNLKDEYIGSEHLFLAIASEKNTSASRVLAEAGVSRWGILEVLPEVRSPTAIPYELPKYRVVGDIRVGAQAGANSQLILAQETSQVQVAPQDVTALIAALAQAAVELTSAQGNQEPS